jgi:hypothetical protein
MKIPITVYERVVFFYEYITALDEGFECTTIDGVKYKISVVNKENK